MILLEGKDEIMPTATSSQVQEVASSLNVLQPDDMLLEQWIGAMNSGAFKFGFGVLRSGSDEYDPFGVLASISGLEFRWDDGEAAWAIDGDAIFLKPAFAAEALGIRHHEDLVKSGVYDRIKNFQDTLLLFADGVGSFSEIADLLMRGRARAKEERERFDRTRIGGLRTIGDGRDYESDYMIRGSRSPYLDPRY